MNKPESFNFPAVKAKVLKQCLPGIRVSNILLKKISWELLHIIFPSFIY